MSSLNYFGKNIHTQTLLNKPTQLVKLITVTDIEEIASYCYGGHKVQSNQDKDSRARRSGLLLLLQSLHNS